MSLASNNKEKERNILLVTPFMGTGGTEKIIYNLCKGLMQNGWKVHLVSSGGRLVKDISKIGVKHTQARSLSSKLPWSIYKSSKTINHIIKEHDIKIVNSHSYISAIVVALTTLMNKKNYKHIFTLHIPEREFYFKIMGLTLNWLVDKVCTVCKWNKEKLIKSGVSKNNVDVIYNGIDIDYFKLNEKKIFNQDKIKIGVVARLVKRKGHQVLLRAIKKLLDNFHYKNIEVYFYGDGPNLKSLKLFTSSLQLQNIVIFCGDTKDIKKAYNNIDLFVLPSFSEGLPLTILEAMCTKVPVITTNINGIPEVINNGVNGITFSPGDHLYLSKIIRDLLEKPRLRDKLINNAYSSVRKNFALDKMISKYDKLFNFYF